MVTVSATDTGEVEKLSHEHSDGFQLREKFSQAGLDPDIIKFLPDLITGIHPLRRRCLLLGDDQRETHALWIFEGRECDLQRRLQLLQEYIGKGFTGFFRPIPFRNENLYLSLDERRWVWMTEWPVSRRVSFRNECDRNTLIDLVLELERISDDPELKPVINDVRVIELLSEYEMMFNDLKAFQYLARYRVRPTRFDELYLQQAPVLIQQAEHALYLLQDCWSLLRQDGKDSLVFNQISRFNFRVDLTGRPLILPSHRYRRGPSIINLACLLLKTGRSNGWKPEWFVSVIQYYEQKRSIAPNEWRFIKAYLDFPWSCFRIAARYYLNLTSWSPHAFYRKFERRLAVETERKQLLRIIWGIFDRCRLKNG